MKKLPAPARLEIRPNQYLSHSQAIMYRVELNNIRNNTRGLPACVTRFLNVNPEEVEFNLNLLNRFLGNTQRVRHKKLPLEPENQAQSIIEKVGFCSACLGITLGLCTICNDSKPKTGTKAYYKKKMPEVQFNAQNEICTKALLGKLQRRLREDRKAILERGAIHPTGSLLPDDVLRENFLEYKNIACQRTVSLPEQRGEIWLDDCQKLTDFDISLIIPESWQASEEIMHVCHEITRLHELPFLLGPLPGSNGLASIGIDLFNMINQC